MFCSTGNVHDLVGVHHTWRLVVDVHLCHPRENDVGLRLGMKMPAGAVGVDRNFGDSHDNVSVIVVVYNVHQFTTVLPATARVSTGRFAGLTNRALRTDTEYVALMGPSLDDAMRRMLQRLLKVPSQASVVTSDRLAR